MAKRRNPRHGSMQFWPRNRSKREYARIRYVAGENDVKLVGFAGYKVGMTHATIIDNSKTSLTKGKPISMPLTIVETPPLKIAGVRVYKQTDDGLKAVTEKISSKVDKELGRKITIPKKESQKEIKAEESDEVRAIVYTQPKLTTIGKKKPEIFEMTIGGKDNKAKYDYIIENIGKEIKVNDAIAEGQSVDIHAITTGKGYQGAVKRFGVGIRQHKSEKQKRGPGNRGPWKGQGHIMYRTAYAGKQGYYQRTEYNKWIVKVGDKPEEVNNKAGFRKYGVVKNQYILVKGSVAGPKKRIIRMVPCYRPNNKIPSQAPEIKFIRK